MGSSLYHMTVLLSAGVVQCTSELCCIYVALIHCHLSPVELLVYCCHYYFTRCTAVASTSGDGARRDKDGYIWITGRVDDVINVSGHR